MIWFTRYFYQQYFLLWMPINLKDLTMIPCGNKLSLKSIDFGVYNLDQ